MAIADKENKKTRPRSGGKPEFIVTPEMIVEAEVLSGRGLTRNQIGDYWGTTRKTIACKARENPELLKALKRGKVKAISFVAGSLMDKIRGGDVSSMIFYLKTQGRWRMADNDTPHEDPDLDGEDGLEDEKIGTKDPNEAAKVYQQIMLGGNK